MFDIDSGGISFTDTLPSWLFLLSQKPFVDDDKESLFKDDERFWEIVEGDETAEFDVLTEWKGSSQGKRVTPWPAILRFLERYSAFTTEEGHLRLLHLNPPLDGKEGEWSMENNSPLTTSSSSKRMSSSKPSSCSWRLIKS